MRTLIVTAAALLAAVGGGVLGATAASAAPFPVTTDVIAAQAAGYLRPATTSPPGANLDHCTDRHGRDPVILLHGTASNQLSAWAYLAPTLANAGFCVFSLTYGQTPWSANIGALADKSESTREVASFIDAVRARTGATKVDLVGHSQGGAIAQLVTQVPGKADQIATIVDVSAPNRGYSNSPWAPRTAPPPAGQGDNSPLHPGIRYFNLASTHDEVVFPLANALMDPAPNVTNIVVESVCPHSVVGHLGMIYSPTVGALVQGALDPRRPVPVPCGADFPA
ncbi:esterase/lipase family protein [Gordonia polyisoprenivorans]|uniref:esterase/lipase family protein n=1 Tax=Gordonia polyisoprenivorans TaxID=84595 RepID=UPI001AD6D949|nr:alpha/beta fold hydrolase [Gordonia polyisoprenivorans]QTI71544.1 alpha/beta fold hydrolase [Gordonia polyisoprenivorans]